MWSAGTSHNVFARFNDLVNICITNNLVPNDPPDFCFHFLEKVLASNRFCTVVANDLSSIMAGILRRHDPTWYHPDGLVSCKRNLDRFLLAWESIQVNPSQDSSLTPSTPIGHPKPLLMNPLSTHLPFSDSDRLAFIQRKDFLTRLINQNDSCQLASLHRRHRNGCFLYKHLPCTHRLLKCRSFLALTKPNPSIAQAIQRELKSSDSLAMLLVKWGHLNLIIIVKPLHPIHLLLFLPYLLLVIRTHHNYPLFPFLPLNPLYLHILSPTSSPIQPSVTPVPLIL